MQVMDMLGIRGSDGNFIGIKVAQRKGAVAGMRWLLAVLLWSASPSSTILCFCCGGCCCRRLTPVELGRCNCLLLAHAAMLHLLQVVFVYGHTATAILRTYNQNAFTA